MERIFYKIYDSFSEEQRANIPSGKLPLKVYGWVTSWARARSQYGFYTKESLREVFREVRMKLCMVHKERRDEK